MTVRCLYIVYWGATEPIGRAGTVPTVCRLQREHGEYVHLLTFDKQEEYNNPVLRNEVEQQLRQASVHWTNLGYSKRPANISSFYDVARGVRAAMAIVRNENINVVHARTYVGALIGACLRRLLDVPVLIHPDGFWPEERVDDGIWSEASMQVRLARRLHWDAYRHADAILTLSEPARACVAADPVVKTRGTPIRVLHTSVDASRFAPRQDVWLRDRPLTLGYIGSMGGRYRTPEVMRVFRIALLRGWNVLIVSRTDHGQIRSWAQQSGIASHQLTIASSAASEMPNFAARMDAGVFLLGGKSAFATSSTKVGEYLAAGLPVLIGAGAGSQDTLIEENGVGVVLREATDAHIEQAFCELEALLAIDGTRARARATAIAKMGVEFAASVQFAMHRDLLRRHGVGA